jgi:hypothetical protein
MAIDASSLDDAARPEPVGAAARLAHLAVRAAGLLRVEDWLLAGMMGIAGPALLAAQGGGGPFEPGRPIDGLIRMAGFAGALACLATRNPSPTARGDAAAGGVTAENRMTAAAGASGERTVLDSAAVGPLTGGLLLVGGSAMASVGADPEVVFGPTLVAVVVFTLVGTHRPVLPTVVRRALVTPFVLAAGGLFWGVVREIAGSADFTSQIGRSFAADAQTTVFVLGLLVASAGVFYAMLVYAPRQVAEREGGPIAWLLRFALFVLGVGFGLGWLAALGS